MGLLIDSSVLIEVERGRVPLDSPAAGRGDEPVFLSAVTAAELLLGVRLAADASHRAKRAAFVEHVLRAVPVLPIDVGVARVHAEHRRICDTLRPARSEPNSLPRSPP